MSRTDSDDLGFIASGCAVGIIVGLFIGIIVADGGWKNRAIKAGAAHYVINQEGYTKLIVGNEPVPEGFK